MRAHVRKLYGVVLAVIALFSWSSLVRVGAEDCAEDLAHPPGEVVEGKTAGEWSARHWQWLAAIPKSSNPALDPTGEHCALEQADPVFLLAGDFIGGSQPTVRTECSVPCGRNLFMPIFSTIWWAPGDCDPGQIDICRGKAEENVKKVVERRLIVDGRSVGCLEDHRAISPEFQFTVPPDNLFDLPPPLERTGVADGFYVILRPLPPGEHTIKWNIRFEGDEDFIPALTYVLTVGPCDFRRGDCDGNGAVNVTDAVATLNFLFAGADPLPCLDAADSNHDGGLNVTDAVHTLLWLFQGGTIPPAPGPSDCGVDPTEDSLDCGKGC